MKAVRWIAGITLALLIAFGVYLGFKDIATPDQDQAGPPATGQFKSFFDANTNIWLEYPESGHVTQAKAVPALDPPAPIKPVVRLPLWLIDTGPADGAEVTIWTIPTQVDMGSSPTENRPTIETIGADIYKNIEQQFGQAMPLAAASVSDAGMGGKRVDYAFRVGDPGAEASLVRYAVLALAPDRVFLVWSMVPLNDRSMIDHVVKSVRFRRADRSI